MDKELTEAIQAVADAKLIYDMADQCFENVTWHSLKQAEARLSALIALRKEDK
jgi:hypothetical protein